MKPAGFSGLTRPRKGERSPTRSRPDASATFLPAISPAPIRCSSRAIGSSSRTASPLPSEARVSVPSSRSATAPNSKGCFASSMVCGASPMRCVPRPTSSRTSCISWLGSSSSGAPTRQCASSRRPRSSTKSSSTSCSSASVTRRSRRSFSRRRRSRPRGASSSVSRARPGCPPTPRMPAISSPSWATSSTTRSTPSPRHRATVGSRWPSRPDPAAEALRLAEESRPDLVLLDISLPDRSGLEVLRALHAPGRHPVDVIAVTAARDVETLRDALQGGVLHYLVKPFQFTAFREKLESYAALRAKLAQPRELDQSEIDRIYGLLRSEPSASLPKGLSPTTLTLVVRALRDAVDDVSAVDIARTTGISRVTSRRYLDHLARSGVVAISMRYGSAGRPEHRYRLAAAVGERVD